MADKLKEPQSHFPSIEAKYVKPVGHSFKIPSKLK